MVIKENDLLDLIKESIIEYINENKSVLRETFEDFGGYYQMEGDDDGRLSDMNTESDDEAETRDSIESFFKQPGVNNAPYAYKLYNVEPEKGKDTNDMKNARKKFSDALNHVKNEKGYPYSFSSSQLNTLKNMISSNELSESVKKRKIGELLKENTENRIEFTKKWRAKNKRTYEVSISLERDEENYNHLFGSYEYSDNMGEYAEGELEIENRNVVNFDGVGANLELPGAVYYVLEKKGLID